MRPYLGQRRPVLWEGKGSANEDGTRTYRGYTDNYWRVEATLPQGASAPTQIDEAVLAGISTAPADRFLAELPEENA